MVAESSDRYMITWHPDGTIEKRLMTPEDEAALGTPPAAPWEQEFKGGNDA